MNRVFFAVAALVTSAVAPCALADGPLLWSDNSVSYLYGKKFEINPPIQQTFTLEHASSWAIGDLFSYLDYTEYNGQRDANYGAASYYGEFSPRLSFNKVMGYAPHDGFVSDMLLAGSYEFGEGNVETLLLGLGLDLNVPAFDFVQFNIYRRMPSHDRDGETVQLTPRWAMTIPVGPSALLFDGVIDWNITSDGAYRRNLHINPQLKYDIGRLFGWRSKMLYAGAEYSYWQNKYGVKGIDESVTSALVKLHF